MSDLMREQFEDWSGNKSDKEIHQRGPRIGKYKNPVMQRSWESWQASRECLVIELPEPRAARGYGEQVADALGFNDGINYCEEAIHAAGVKTK